MSKAANDWLEVITYGHPNKNMWDSFYLPIGAAPTLAFDAGAAHERKRILKRLSLRAPCDQCNIFLSIKDLEQIINEAE